MWKAFLSLWKNIFNYKGVSTRKEFWLGALSQIIFMYIAVVPCALLLRVVTIPLPVFFTVFFTIMGVPLISLFVRRANDIKLTAIDILLVAFFVPVVGAMIIGMYPSLNEQQGKTVLPWCFRGVIVGIGLFVYGGFGGIVFLGSPDATLPIVGTGLILATVSMIVGAIRNKYFS